MSTSLTVLRGVWTHRKNILHFVFFLAPICPCLTCWLHHQHRTPQHRSFQKKNRSHLVNIRSHSLKFNSEKSEAFVLNCHDHSSPARSLGNSVLKTADHLSCSIFQLPSLSTTLVIFWLLTFFVKDLLTASYASVASRKLWLTVVNLPVSTML